MALKDALRRRLDALRVRADRLREGLRADERIEERGWDRGWRPQAAASGAHAEAASRAGRDRRTGGPLKDAPWVETPDLLQLTPDAEALATYEAGAVWDLTSPVGARWRAAREGGRGTLLLACTLSHCGWSDRVAEALQRARPLWEPDAEVIVARAGDRLQKVYFRDLQLGSLTLTLPTFPTTLRFAVAEEGLRLTHLAFDPLGPSPDHGPVRRLLGGESVVPPGSDHFVVTACTGSLCTRIGRAGGFEADLLARV